MTDLTFSVRKQVHHIAVSWELIEDMPFELEFWDEEQWAAHVEILRGIRRALQNQPIVSLKVAATKAIKRAERVTDFPVWQWVDNPWKHRATWYDVP